MEEILIKKFAKKFADLRTAKLNGEAAPHKPVLLLSLILSIENREINDNKICITPELVAHFKDTWTLLVKSDQFTCNFFLPFFHLRSEGFWFLQTYPGKEILLTSSHSIRGFGQLKDAVAFAYLDETLFLLLMDATSRSILKTVLLTHYFPEFSMLPLGLPSSTVETISDQILHESPVAYQAEIKKADEEEIFVRNGVFKKVVPAIYGYTCCISGMRITATTPVQMIDACHIVPFVMSFDDTISNGFSLCPNLHRAFDRGLIAVDENYQIIVSDIFTETEGGYSIKPYQGKRILLPEKKEQLPSVANFEWHRKNIFKANGVGA